MSDLRAVAQVADYVDQALGEDSYMCDRGLRGLESLTNDELSPLGAHVLRRLARSAHMFGGYRDLGARLNRIAKEVRDV